MISEEIPMLLEFKFTLNTTAFQFSYISIMLALCNHCIVAHQRKKFHLQDFFLLKTRLRTGCLLVKFLKNLVLIRTNSDLKDIFRWLY